MKKFILTSLPETKAGTVQEWNYNNDADIASRLQHYIYNITYAKSLQFNLIIRQRSSLFS